MISLSSSALPRLRASGTKGFQLKIYRAGSQACRQAGTGNPNPPNHGQAGNFAPKTQRGAERAQVVPGRACIRGSLASPEKTPPEWWLRASKITSKKFCEGIQNCSPAAAPPAPSQTNKVWARGSFATTKPSKKHRERAFRPQHQLHHAPPVFFCRGQTDPSTHETTSTRLNMRRFRPTPSPAHHVPTSHNSWHMNTASYSELP